MRALISQVEAGACPSMRTIVETFGAHLPLLRRLESTAQDPGWHAEGNVLVHSDMVLVALYELLATRATHIQGLRRSQLVFGAAFHDIAKPLRTREMDIGGVRRIAAPAHELRGRDYLAANLAGPDFDYAWAHAVGDLTGYHVVPKRLVVKGQARGAYLRLARMADPELLYWLELADMQGRRCADRDTQIEHIEMFAMFAREHGAWTRFGDDAAAWRAQVREELGHLSPALGDLSHAYVVEELEAGRVFDVQEGLAKGYRFREGLAEVVVMCGPSGAGKSTWAATHLADHEQISLDEIRAELGSINDQSNNARVVQIAKERLRVALREGGKVVWDATSLRRDFRDAVTRVARDYEALVTMVAFHLSPEACADANAARDRRVPAKVLARQFDQLQWPELHEAHRTLVVGARGQLLACYGCIHEELPYGLRDAPSVSRERRLAPRPGPSPEV